MAVEVPCYFPNHFTYKKLALSDISDQSLLDVFEEAFSFIDSALSGPAAQKISPEELELTESEQESWEKEIPAHGRVLVHCIQGISRSATIVIGYLMSRERMSLREAYEKVTTLRPISKPNVGFIEQLRQLEKQIFGTNTLSVEDVYSEGTVLLLHSEDPAANERLGRMKVDMLNAVKNFNKKNLQVMHDDDDDQTIQVRGNQAQVLESKCYEDPIVSNTPQIESILFIIYY